MRIRIAILFLACLFAMPCGPALAGGALTVDHDLLEFGRLKEGVVAKKTVQVSNTGDAPLSIANVSTSCACTTTTLGRAALNPGESTSLEIMYNTFKFPGVFKKFVTLAWGENGREKTVITLVGDVDPIPMGVLEAEPRKVEAGSMAVGSPVRLEFTLRNTGDAPLRVDKVAAQKAGTVFFDAAKEGPLTLKPGEEKRLTVTVTASAPGNYIEYIMVHSDARNVTDKGYKVVLVGAAK